MEITNAQMIEQKGVPQRYKRSSLGIIPQEWQIMPLSALGEIYSGGTPSTDNPTFWNGDVLWCTSSDVTNLSTNYICNTENKITTTGLIKSSAILLPVGSLIVCTRATIGNTAITTKPLATNQGFKNIVPNEGINIEWLFYSILFSKNRLVKLGCGSTFSEVSKKDFERFKIPVPPIEEQKKIAELLSEWDKAIELQTKLIEKLELRKRALMQRLLTGRIRLNDFSDKWEMVKLSQIGFVYNGLSGKSKNDFDKGDSQFITYMNVFSNGCIKQDMLGNVNITSEEKQNQVQYGDIFFTISSETPEEVGMASVLLQELANTYLNSFCFGFRPYNFNTLLPNFAMYYFRSSEFRKKMYIIAQGSTRYNIGKSDVLGMNICIPTIAEQHSIAEVLISVDKEIEIAKTKLSSFRNQKRGLMQQLLTGKKRINYGKRIG